MDNRPVIEYDLQLFAEEEGEAVTEPTPEGEVDGGEEFEAGAEGEATEESELKPHEIDYKFLDEEGVLNVAEEKERARELIQKGMNHDRLSEKLSSYEKELEDLKGIKDDPLYGWAKKIMEDSGYEDSQEFLKEMEINNKASRYAQNGMSKEAARKEAERDYRMEELERKLEEKEKKEKRDKEMESFLEWYDEKQEKGVFDEEFDPESVPPELWEKVEQGEDFKELFMEYALENIVQNKEQDTLKKIKENEETSTGSTKQTAPKEDAGHWSVDYINDMIDKYGEEWIDENFDKIERSGYFKKF